MNRKNFLVHFGLAISVILIAAILGQVRRFENSVSNDTSKGKSQTKACAFMRSSQEREPEALVKFRADVTVNEIKKLTNRNNDLIADGIEAVNGLYAIDDLDGRTAQEVADEYNRLSEVVLYAEPNQTIKLEPVNAEDNSSPLVGEDDDENLPDDPYFSVQWALHNIGQSNGKEKADIGAVKAWAKTKGSTEVVIAVLDSGVDYTHSDLSANMWSRPDSIASYKDSSLGDIDDQNGYNAADNNGDPMDDNGHGTHCAGIIGAEGNNALGVTGVNWDVQIMPLKFIGKGGFGTTANAIEAINYVIDRKKAGVNVRVISASWGSTSYSKALGDVIEKAGSEGILFIAASGNSGQNADNNPHYPASYKLPNVISVAALDRNDNLTSFSNYGVKTVHIAAPGKDIMSTWLKENYREASGTSMATPQVSGVAGLVLSVSPDITVETLRERILKSGDKIDSLNGKIQNGVKLNAAKAVGE
ncbi:MAG: S8 family serine peptidase [Pyrinomonadaceae bacterium]|nr:S8 family serine peptidase [Pyrinomonadaceae bacterium]